MAEEIKTSYCIEFNGAIHKDRALDEVTANLSKLFQTEDSGKIDRLFRNTPTMLKRNLSHEQALKYQQRFEKTGACCQILEERSEADAISSPTAEQGPSVRKKPVNADRTPSPSTTRALTSHAKPAVKSKSDRPILVTVGGVFLVAGLVALGFAVMITWSAIRSYTTYQDGRCTIQSKQIIEDDDDDGTTYRPHFEFTVRTNEGEIYAASGYRVDTISSSGRRNKETILERFDVGETYPCWYDPDLPSQAVLARGFPWIAAIIALFSLPFLLAGGFVVAAGVRKGRTTSSAETAGSPPKNSGNRAFVPLKATFTPSIQMPLPVALFTGLIFTGICVGLLIAMKTEFDFSPGGAVAAGFFGLIGLSFLSAVFKQIAERRRVQHTRIELQGGLVSPGGKSSARLSQAGRLRIKTWRLTLVGKEKISYTDGTDTLHKEHVFYNEEIMNQLQVSDNEIDFSIPPDAMPSFKAGHNEIQWVFVVEITAHNKPALTMEFPFQVAS